MTSMAAVQLEYIRVQSEGNKTEAVKAAARANDKAAHAELNTLRARACNTECFDCTATKPGWAVLPWGTFVCIDCAQVHRNMGRHISQTKAINTGTYLWFEHELPVMRTIGNAVAARAFGGEAQAAKPSRDAPAPVKVAYAQAKYVDHRWGTPQFLEATTQPPQRVPEQVTAPTLRDKTALRVSPPKPAPKPTAQPPADWDTFFSDFEVAPAAPAAAVASSAAAEVLRLFDPLPTLAMQPTKALCPLSSGCDDSARSFFAQYGL